MSAQVSLPMTGVGDCHAQLIGGAAYVFSKSGLSLKFEKRGDGASLAAAIEQAEALLDAAEVQS